MPRPEKLEVFTAFAESLAKLSTCKRAAVGCVIVPADYSAVYAIGYNGQPSGEPHDACLRDLPGQCGCVHAEANALVKLGDVRDATLISTTAPCLACAGLIINSKKIERVLYRSTYRTSAGMLLLERQGIPCVPFQTVEF